ncbi:MAG: hypothetical protein K8F24_07095 [Bacteroidales bacterium]|nr:hypothetical protein [Bacteroidales bacterium]
MKQLFFWFGTLIILNSCVVQGLTNDFGKLNDSEKALIHDFEGFSEVESRAIYEINGKALREELKNHPKSIVYKLSNGCPSEYCKPLQLYENFAKEHDYHLFMVMIGYANLYETMEQPFSSPLYAIDTDYYETSISYKYNRYFDNDFMGLETKAKQGEYAGSLYFFEGDSLVEVRRELPEELNSQD